MHLISASKHKAQHTFSHRKITSNVGICQALAASVLCITCIYTACLSARHVDIKIKGKNVQKQ